MKNKILKTILSSSVLATTAIPVITTTSCAQETGMTGEWFEDLPEIEGCQNDEYDIPTGDDFVLKEGANDFGGFNKSEPEWFLDEGCTEKATDMGQIPDQEPGETVRYAKLDITFLTAGYKSVSIVKPVTIKIATTKAVDFEKDAWATFMYHVSRKLDHLKEAYPDEWARADASTGKKANSFVGSIRKLKMNDLEYTVRVIGENHDVLYDKPTENATLTFEFTQVISSKDEKGKISAKTFTWSNVRDYKSNFSSKVEELFKDLPSFIQKKIKSVKKSYAYTNVTYPDTESDFVKKEASFKLFLLSSSETVGTYFTNLGARYSWYSSASAQMRIKKDLSGNATNYWTRTPSEKLFPMPPEAYYITKTGSIDYTKYMQTSSYPIAPAFCL